MNEDNNELINPPYFYLKIDDKNITKDKLYSKIKNIFPHIDIIFPYLPTEFLKGKIEIFEYNKNILFIYHDRYDFIILGDNNKNINILKLNRKKKYYIFNNQRYAFSSDNYDELTRTNSINDIKAFLNKIKEIYNKGDMKVLDPYYLYLDLNIYDEDKFNIINENDVIMLALPNFRSSKKSKSLNFKIVNKKTHEFIGYIECNLGEDNFSYGGNVSYLIYPPFQNKHYGTLALKLLCEFVCEYESFIDHNLYISMTLDNIASEHVSLNNKASLYYEGDVPKSDRVYYHNKIKKVKIYKIDCNKKENRHE